MAIDTMGFYHPQMQYPVWIKIGYPKHNDYKVGRTYDIRVEDGERAAESGDGGAYNYAHEATLIAKREDNLEDLNNVLLAFLGDSKDPEEVKKRLLPEGIDGYNDRKVLLLVFLRLDKAKEQVQSDETIIEGDFSKIDAEDDD